MEDGRHLNKVFIQAFEDKDFQFKSSSSPEPIFLPVNPESLTHNFGVRLNRQQGQGNQGTNPNYNGTPPEELKIDFILDGTNTIEGYKYNGDDHSVKEQLAIFMNTVYQMNSDIHRPNFLKVHWGKFIFSCILSTIGLNYALFKPNGDPLRVKVSATFLEYIDQKERVAREGKKSPDLTHMRQVKAGDRLDLMTYKIYKHSKYVTQIAKANGLTTFRDIQKIIGRDIIFPPLDKTAV